MEAEASSAAAACAVAPLDICTEAVEMLWLAAATGWIVKPCSGDDLIRVIKKALPGA
jgi:hypothetical protein